MASAFGDDIVVAQAPDKYTCGKTTCDGTFDNHEQLDAHVKAAHTPNTIKW